MAQRFTGEVVLENGETAIAEDIVIGNATLMALQFPADFTGTAVTFEVSIIGLDYATLRDPSDGSVVTLTVDAGACCVYLDPVWTHGFGYIRIISGTAQTGDVTIAYSTAEV